MFKNVITVIANAIRENLFKSWLILYCIWLVDFLSTAIALVVIKEGVFVETNLVAAWFFEWGIGGWFAFAVVCGLLIYLILRIPKCFLFLTDFFKRNKEKKKTNERISEYLHLIVFFGLILSEGYIIIYNVHGLLQYIGFL